MNSILYFDAEDSISPPEAGCDDILLWLAELLERYGITGSFHLIGDKARCLEQRGRQDVIRAVARHDVSSHFNHGSVHPTTTERVAEANWEEGVRVALEEERPGFADIERIFGKCSALTRHGGSYAPQIVRAAGLCGRTFYGAPFQLPGHRAFWFCGNLVFSIRGLIMDGIGDVPGENDYADDARFEASMARFRPALEKTMATWDFTALFGAHPHRLLTTEFSCWNHYGGVNNPNPKPPPQRTAEARATIRRNFERYVTYLASFKDLQIVGLDELATRYRASPTEIDAGHLHAYARRVRESDEVPLDELFSPAELMTALAEAIGHHGKTGHLPERQTVRLVIGPTAPGKSVRVNTEVSSQSIYRLASEVFAHVCVTGALPGSAGQFSTASTLGLLAEFYDDLRTEHEVTRHRTCERASYPRIADDWAAATSSLKAWRVFSPQLSFQQIADHTRWQTWSVKPARQSA